MKLAIVGLGKMGGNMARRLVEKGHEVVAFNRHPDKTKELQSEIGVDAAFSLKEVVEHLEAPRVVWLMIPAGDPVEDAIDELIPLLEKDDIIVEGGNSNFRDSMRRAKKLAEHKIHMLDVGVSGGIWGLKVGYGMMVGGEEAVVDQIRPIFEALAPGPNKGWARMGPSGAGHFVKMVHNGIEYGMMEAYAEGFEIMRAREDFNLDLHQIAEAWRYGTVIRSWLLDLTADALKKDQDLSDIAPWVADSGEGRWTAFEAINEAISAPVITLALMQRFESRQDGRYADRLLAAMRNEFGGHAIKKSEE